MHKRGNGGGSISRHGEGWRLRWMMPDGSRRSKILPKMTRTAAERHLEELLVDVRRGDYTEPVKPIRAMTFADLTQEFLAFKQPQVKLGTYRNYLSLLKGPLKPFEKMTLEQINQRTVDQWWARKAGHPVNRRNAYFALRGMFKLGVRWGYVSAIPFEIENAGRDVAVPRPDWTVADFDAVLAHVGDLYRPALEVMFSAHLRLGELIALNGSDYRDGALRIVRQRTKEGQLADTKTGQHGTTRLLKRGIEALEARPRVIGTAPLFPGEKSARMPRASLQKAWNDACEAAGLSNFHLHDVRHVSLSLVAEAGASEKVVQQRARHASSTSTRRYLHTSERMHAEAVEKVDQLVDRLRATS